MRRLLLGLILLLLGSNSALVYSQSRMESEYHRVCGLYESRDKNALRQLRSYLDDYPYTTFESEVYFMMGVVQVEKGYYKKAIRDFERCQFKDLARPHQPQYQFYRGYAHLMQSDYEKASLYFGNLGKHKSPYKQKADYYYAYCQYKLGDYDKALPALLDLEKEYEYRETVPYYIVQIYYAREQYEDVRAKAEQLLDEQPDNANNGELHRMLGEIYYRQERYRDAVRELAEYDSVFTAMQKPVLRNDLYMLAVAYYRTDDYLQAINTFKRVEPQQDEISEDVNLCLGHAYLKTGDVEQAKLAYLAAKSYNINPQVHEEAMYNYALAVYQSSSSIGESETVFTDFLREYPKSEHVNEIYMLLSDAFRRAHNYKAALSALDSVSQPNKAMLETKQYLRYQLGSDAFVRGKFGEARDWFGAVTSDNIRTGLQTDAYYWRAESDYRLGDYASCQQDLDAFFGRSDAAQSPNYMSADYLRGYAFFQQKDYAAARSAFERYKGNDTKMQADALNRIGDCWFYERHFAEACAAYERAAAMKTTGADYALFQQGYAYGLQRQMQDKVATLQKLVGYYPKSDYADDALYEIARAQLSLENEAGAVEAYGKLLDKYPQSTWARSASMELAMAYRNMHSYDQAMAAYKHTIERYPASKEAYLAVEGLESVCIETNRVNEYLDYSKKLSKLNMQVATKDDSLAYVAAELQLRQGNTDVALAQFAPLADRQGSAYAEPSAMQSAEIYFERNDYANALTFYRKSLAVASKRKNTIAARVGIMRCAVALDDMPTLIEIATAILSDPPVEADIEQEARYNRAKANIALQNKQEAIADLESISSDVRTGIGAESKYLLAQTYFDLGDLDKAEAEVMSFAQQPTQQQYWLARSLIVLAQVSKQRGDEFQARQYLLSLKANYTHADDILQRVDEQLALLEPVSEVPQENEED